VQKEDGEPVEKEDEEPVQKEDEEPKCSKEARKRPRSDITEFLRGV
jgi:hypothetical protein